MRKRLFIILLCCQNCCFGQQRIEQEKLRFQSINHIGFVQGESGSALLFQSINGIGYHSFFTGLGVGIDAYKELTIPIFLAIRKNILKKQNTPFVYVDGGHHFVWSKKVKEPWINRGYTGGLFYDFGIGYKIAAPSSNSVNISLGYSQKSLTEDKNMHPERSTLPQPDDYAKFEYQLKRVAFKIGLTF